MKIACSSQSFDRLFAAGQMDAFDFIEYAKDGLGLDGVEFEDKHITDTNPAYLARIGKACSERGLAVANLAFFNSFGFPTREENLAEVERAARWMDVAAGLRAENFRIFAGWMGGPDREIGFNGSILPKTPEAWNGMVECVIAACREAAKRLLPAVIENHNHGGFLSTSADVERLFREAKAENLSLLLDTGNYADGLDGVRKTIQRAKRHIHLKCREIRPDGRDAAFDLDAVLDIVTGSGFSGNLSIEYEGTQEEKAVLPRLVGFIRNKIAGIS